VIGIRSLAVALLLLASLLVAIALGALDAAELSRLTEPSCLVLGALAAAATGLAGTGGALTRPGGAAWDVRHLRIVVETPAAKLADEGAASAVRQLPGWVLRGLLGGSFLILGMVALGNHGVTRLRELGAGGPPAGRCKDPEPQAAEAEEAPPPPPPPVDQAGCALVRRAYQLGYSKSLGSCAPKQAPVAVATPKVALSPEVCTRRQVDEPFFHYAARRWAEAAGWVAASQPVHGTNKRAEEMRLRLGFFGTLTASSGHALGATPHAAHHLWISLPDPEPVGWFTRLVSKEDCGAHYVKLALWPRFRAGQEGALVQHALGQLLFASRFGTVTSCANYRLHWGAATDACDRLVADPQGFLRQQGAWDEVAGVLDRRRRQLEVRALAKRIGQAEPPEPPPASAVVSLQCMSVDAGVARAEVRGKVVVIDGQRLSARQLRVPRVSTDDNGALDVIAALAQWLAGPQPGSAASIAEVIDAAEEQGGGEGGPRGSADGSDQGGAAPLAAPLAAPAPRPAPTPAPRLLDGPGFALARLEPIEGSDPFAGARWPLARAELVEIYPFQRVLFEFIDGFRRRYFAQRGRL
jgi:hypothetical protein